MAGLERARLQGLSDEDRRALDELLEANGLTQDQLLTEQVTHLEMFLHEYPKMAGLQFFPHLKTLCLIHQDIRDIACLDDCVALEKVFIVEGQIKQIKGLDRLRNLRELYLYSNRITRIEGLQNLANLEVLSLADNYITSIEGLGQLLKLRELNLARNDIQLVGDALSANTSLEILNLSDNNIGSFKEIRPLSRLPRLVELCFADPMWGECPLAGLCNYQTYVLFMLPKLTCLDTLLLADETKQLAEATFLKKQMYYNMRIKTMHRDARNIIRLAAEGKKNKLQYGRPLMNRLVLQQKDIQRELEEAQWYGSGRVDDGTMEGLKAKLETINERLSHHSRQAAEADSYFEECASRTYQLVDTHVRRMMLELDTAGNIRLEEGKATDLWYTSCVDLLQSRFNAGDYDSLGVSGITVTGVTRIHNRWLRNRFERQLAQLVDTSDQGYKRSMEYLFIGDHPALVGEMDRVVERGFRNPAELSSMGLDGAVVLSNSVYLADQLRLQLMLEQRSSSSSSSSSSQHDNVAVGRIMIVKAYLGRSASDGTTAGARGNNKLLKEGRFNIAATLEGPRITKAGFPDADSVYRTRPGDTKQRLWYVLDNVLVLPEYLVEFQYDVTGGSRLVAPSSSGGMAELQLSSATTAAVVESLEPELRPLARPLMSWLALYHDPQLARNTHGPVSAAQEEAEVNALLEQAPAVAARSKLYMVAEDTLSKHLPAGGPTLTSLTYLNLHNCALRKIENLGLLRDLKVLVLTFNDITRMEGLAELSCLQRLDLGHNLIRKVEGIKGMSTLLHLDLSSNQISKLEELYCVKKYVPQLTYLDMSNNPLCEDKSYRSTVMRKMKSLATFDQLPITADDKAAYAENAGAVTLQMVQEHGTVGSRFSVSEPSSSGSGTVDLSSITELVLERKHIRRLQHLVGLPSLRRASFLDNQISHIEGLEGCTALEELCLEDNRIAQVEGLTGLTRLKKLQLGKNRLAALEMMSCVTNLTQLSVEDNELTSLAGIEPLAMLMELYAGNNRIVELREVQRLRELPKIIILDLSGNPCTGGGPGAGNSSALASPVVGPSANDEYRLYVIYNVRKLKVLDGVPIDAAEQAAAKSKYSGRLTLDFLEEKLGHRMFDRIRDLDISGLKLRDVGSAFLGDEFECLQELNLDNNTLVDISGLALLRQLSVLKLNNNRLGEECTFNPRRMVEKSPELYRALTASTSSSTQGRAPSGGAAVAALELFPVIQVLQLGGNQISAISSLQLASLTNLRTLFLQNNDITRIDGLEGLVSLQELVLDRNRIRYVDPDAFVGLPRLRELRLEENGLRSLSNLHLLTGLQALHVGHNRISEAADLDRLSGLVNLLEVTLVNNPISRKQAYRPMLLSRCARLYVLDGVVISPEERDEADRMFNPQPVSQDVVPGAKQQVAIRMTNVDFSALSAAAGQFGPQFGAAAIAGNAAGGAFPVSSVPSIQSNTIVLSGPSGFGLEGIGLRDAPGVVGPTDPWGRPTSNDKRGAVSRASPAKDASPGGKMGSGPSASPARRAGLMGRPPNYPRGYI